MKLEHAGPFVLSDGPYWWCQQCFHRGATKEEMDEVTCAPNEDDVRDGTGPLWCLQCGALGPHTTCV